MNNSNRPISPCKAKTGEKRQVEFNTFQDIWEEMPGLTKREYAAIKLYAGMLSAVNSEGEWTGLNCASEAVSQADFLLAELEK